MKAIFNFTPTRRAPGANADSKDLVTQVDFQKYLEEHVDKRLIVTIDEEANYPEKERMYAYLMGPVLDCAVQGFSDAGWEGMDKVAAEHQFKEMFAKDYIIDPDGIPSPYLLEKKRMSKDRLLKYIVDILHFLEAELGQEVPDSEAYKMKLETGVEFRKVK